ncbi:DNA repair protein complementing XP-G cells isoform X2 [Strongylocentrotus purpuratus]|uniref:Uncharacterized protein n=1 Tax=Strongylocentrotus purpuratus TaxID=7668 RepID=A0A7M7NLL9_STRPU|nr:DNA repair protein complementing XP-G cells isoform X2 [Strongylocentrotus purpuratus]
MGVQGLWRLVESTGRPVNLESLEGKVIAVDVSIWLNQAVLGVHGNSLSNPHLQVLFNRICKLLFYRIKPIFVFDGAPPQLKKQTLAARRQRKNLAAARTEKTTERIVKNYMKSHAIQAVIGENGEGTSQDLPPLYIPRKNETDLYELPPLPSNDLHEKNSGSEDEEEEDHISIAMAAHQAEMESRYQDLGELDIESESFKALPVEVQHELITELQESSKKNSWARMHQLPKVSQDFSQYQLKKLLNKGKLRLRLDNLRKEMRTKMSLSMTALLDAQSMSGSQVDAGRVASEDTQHYILMKKGTKPDEESEDESGDDIVVASYAERAGFATSMDLKMQKVMRKRGSAPMATTPSTSSKDDIEIVLLEDDSTPARKKRRRDLGGQEMDESEAVRLDDKASKDEAVKAELKKFFDQLDAKISPSQKQEGSSYAPIPDDVVCLDRVHTSKEALLEIQSAQSGSASTIQSVRTLMDNVIVDEGSTEHDLTMNIGTEKGNTSEPLKTEMSDATIRDHLPKEPSKATENYRTTEGTNEELQTKEEKCEMLSVRDESRTRTLRQVGRTVEIITNIDPKTVERTTTDDSPTADARKVFKEEDRATTQRQDILKKLMKKKEDMKIIEPKTVERTTTDDPSIADAGKVVKEDDRATTQRQDILKELQKKKEDMKNMMKAFESRMDNFDILDVPDDDLAFDAEFTSGIGTESSNPVEISAETPETDVGTKTLDDEVKDTKIVPGSNIGKKEIPDAEVGAKTVHDEDVGAKNTIDALIAAKAGTDAEVNMKNDVDPGKRVVVEITLDEPIQVDGQKADSDPVNTSDLSFMTRTSLDSEWTSTPYQVDSDDDVQRVYMQESDQEPEIDEWHGVYVDKMNEMEKKLHTERLALEKERRKQQKKSYSITDTMYADSKEMLQCFGIPYIESPQEAEAQCAFLDLTNQTEGTITDDGDIWLFGGRRVFRHFFSKKKDPEYFRVGDIERHLLLDRKKLINLAYLVGSDYTLGIQGIGSVGAMEILAEFKGHGLKTLKDFKSWWSRTQDQGVPSLNATRSKWCKLVLPDEFPNPLIAKAYTNPAIDESEEGFQWGLPDLGLLREFARERFGWMKTKLDEQLLPVLQRLNEKQVQSKMTSFFGVAHLGNRKKIASKRMRNALMQMERSSDEEEEESEEEEEESEEEEEERPRKKKRVSTGSVKKRVRRKKKLVQKPTQEGGEEKNKCKQKVKKRVKRKKKVVLNQNNNDTPQEPKQGAGQTKNAPKIQMNEEESAFAERTEVKKSKAQNGKLKPKPNPNKRQKRRVPTVDYAAMMEDNDEDIPDEVLLDVAEDMEMAALMEAGSGHNVTHDLRNISSSDSQPKTGSLNSSIDTDFVEERRGKGSGGQRGGVVPRLVGGGGGGGGRRGKGKRGGPNKGKAIMKKRPGQGDGPKLSSSGTDSD